MRRTAYLIPLLTAAAALALAGCGPSGDGVLSAPSTPVPTTTPARPSPTYSPTPAPTPTTPSPSPTPDGGGCTVTVSENGGRVQISDGKLEMGNGVFVTCPGGPRMEILRDGDSAYVVECEGDRLHLADGDSGRVGPYKARMEGRDDGAVLTFELVD